jgi:MarR family transcriptional regulator, organic hydroperoxide resistance regulator
MINTQINDRIMEVFYEISRSIREKMAYSYEATQLTVLQLQTLVFITKNKVISMGDLANEFKISLPTATVLSDKLVNLGIIKRIESKNDRRIVNISLTEKGKSLFKKAMKQRHLKVNKILAYLSSRDRKELLRILDNLASNIGKTYEK